MFLRFSKWQSACQYYILPITVQINKYWPNGQITKQASKDRHRGKNIYISVAIRECIEDMLQVLQESLAFCAPFSVHVGGAEPNQGNQPNIPTVLNQIIVEGLNASTCSIVLVQF